MAAPATVEAYLATLAPDRRARLETLGRVAQDAAPGAVETIAYGMPCLHLDGRFLVSWSAFKAHDSLFPASERVVVELADAVAPHVTGKGTLRFPLAQPLPLDLIGRIVAIRVAEHG
jgi:uncharacterized protein YdhG (YjbR/CyaY superfamily)